MTATNKIRVLLPALLLCCGNHLSAQGYRLKALLEIPPATGFYQVAVSSPVAAAAKADLSDLRIAAGKDTIPYLVRRHDAVWKAAELSPYTILANHTGDSGRTVLDIGGLPAEGIGDLSLVIANTSVARYTSVSGSNDGRHWYIISERLLIGGQGSAGDGTYMQPLSFPRSRYNMLRLTIDNHHSNPLNILQAGAYGNSTITSEAWTENPAMTATQLDSSNKRSYVTLHGNRTHLAERLMLTVNGPKFYSRTATLYALAGTATQHGDAQQTATLQLQPGAPAAVSFSALKAQDWRLEIDNSDNPPLRIIAAATAYRTPYLAAWLEAGRQYTLLAGNPAAPAPQYDLGHFADSIPAAISTLAYGRPTAIAAPPESAPEAPARQRYWIWLAIGVAVTVLAALTWRLLRDMNRKEAEDRA